MSYLLYTDKPNKFNCNIQIEGTSLAKSKVRLVIETDEMSYMFNGFIENTGVCEVNIPKTKHFLPEGTKGNMRLEVIADDVYFEPWSSDFGVKTNKKVNVVVSEQEEEKPRLTVEVFQQEESIIEEPKVKVVENTRKPNSVKTPNKKIVENVFKKPENVVIKTKSGKKLQITKEQFLRNFGNLK
jgi:hypothetical protein